MFVRAFCNETTRVVYIGSLSTGEDLRAISLLERHDYRVFEIVELCHPRDSIRDSKNGEDRTVSVFVRYAYVSSVDPREILREILERSGRIRWIFSWDKSNGTINVERTRGVLSECKIVGEIWIRIAKLTGHAQCPPRILSGYTFTSCRERKFWYAKGSVRCTVSARNPHSIRFDNSVRSDSTPPVPVGSISVCTHSYVAATLLYLDTDGETRECRKWIYYISPYTGCTTSCRYSSWIAVLCTGL